MSFDNEKINEKDLIEIDPKKKEELKEYFEMFDRDGDGLVGKIELGNILRCIGYEQSEQDVNEWINEFDEDGDKKINFEEFISLMLRYLIVNDVEDELIEAFKIFDKGGNGTITVNELKHVMMTLGEKLPEEEVDEMIKEADPNNEGVIQYSEFSKLLLKR